MKIIFILVFTAFPGLAFGATECGLEDIGLEHSSNRAEKLFYTGTCHYRNEDYVLAVEKWEELLSLEGIDPEYEELQIDALNNLGFMLFFGYGTEKDKAGAVGYWKSAILMGHEESEYHLCHAYAEKDQPTFHLAKARKHCRKALLIYRGMDDPDEEILQQIKKYNLSVSN